MPFVVDIDAADPTRERRERIAIGSLIGEADADGSLDRITRLARETEDALAAVRRELRGIHARHLEPRLEEMAAGTAADTVADPFDRAKLGLADLEPAVAATDDEGR